MSVCILENEIYIVRNTLETCIKQNTESIFVEKKHNKCFYADHERPVKNDEIIFCCLHSDQNSNSFWRFWSSTLDSASQRYHKNTK